MPKAPNNADIMESLAEISSAVGRVEARGEATHNLAVKTNGRVTELERKWERREAVEEYKKETEVHPVPTVKVENNTMQWDFKSILTLIGVIAAAVAATISQLVKS